MRVCLIAPIPPYRGGIAKYCYSLARELEKRHELLLLSYKRQYPAFLYGRKSQVDPDVSSIDTAKEFRHLSYDIDSVNIASWMETSRKIAAFDPELVIFPWWVTYWAPMYLYLLHSLKKKGIRVVFICINVFEHEDSFLKKLVTRFVLRRIGSVIVHSEQEKSDILEFHPDAAVKKHLLPLFEYDSREPTGKDKDLHLLFFGFVRPYKGLDTLLHAVAILKDHALSVKVVGEFWHDKEEYLKLIRDLGISEKMEIVDHYIPDSEMSLYFSWADLVVVPYKKSKTSGIIATAYGFGKPVLATSVGGFHEVIQDCATGRMVPPDDPQALADGIVWFLNNRQLDFEKNISEFVSRNMSWSSLVDMIEEFRSGGKDVSPI